MKTHNYLLQKNQTEKIDITSNKILLESDLVFYKNGKIDYSLEANMDLERGLFVGIGISLTEEKKVLKRLFIPWDELNSHVITFGTTRQGKSRAMIADIRQQMIRYGKIHGPEGEEYKGDNIVIYEPKGSKGQDIISSTLQYATEYGLEKYIKYLSPFYHKNSLKFNALFGLKSEQKASLIKEIVESQDAFYANIAYTIALCTSIGLDFIEKVDAILNPYDLILMEKMENAKLLTQTTNKINKYIWEEKYDEVKHGITIDILTNLKKDKDKKEVQLIDEAWNRTQLRYLGKDIDEVVPLASFLTFRDLAPFEDLAYLSKLLAHIQTRINIIENIPNTIELRALGNEALTEAKRVCSKDPGFFSKVNTTYSVLMSQLITGDVGKILNDCRINPLMDDLTSETRRIILIIQPFPMIYKTAADAIGKIMFTMLTMAAGYIGASGYGLPQRINLNIDEAGEILTDIVKKLSNKGGGLDFSLYLYTQSLADLLESLGEEGARIILDNLNNKKAFKGNDNTSMEEISKLMGTKKVSKTMTTATDKRDTRTAGTLEEIDIVPMSILQRLKQRKFVMKSGSDVYYGMAPYQPDSLLKVVMPVKSLSDISADNDLKKQEIKEILL